jgi:effector-binding domain-containing protein
MTFTDVAIVEVSPLPLAAVRRQVTSDNLVNTVISAPIWKLSADRGLKTTDQTVLIYHDDGTELLKHSPDGVAIDIGVLLEEPFAGDLMLQCVMTPAGRAAHARQTGPYDLLPATHASIRNWCEVHGHAIVGINWVRYTHWNEDPDKRITDVYYLLA